MVAVDKVIADHPDFVMAHAFRAGVLATATDKAFESELIKSVGAAEALAAKANDRERVHISAARAWLDGEWERAIELWGRASIAHPRDLLALQLAHVGDFFLGHSHMLRDRVARVLPHWSRDVPGYGFVEGMYAFGLEEAGDYAQAEARGREAVSLNRQDGWSVHAVAHVLEMQGRAAEGAAFLAGGADGWTLHDLRRTGGTLMQAMGVPLDVIDRCQNHKLPGPKVRRHYLHHDYAGEKRDAWNRLGEHLEKILAKSASAEQHARREQSREARIAAATRRLLAGTESLEPISQALRTLPARR